MGSDLILILLLTGYTHVYLIKIDDFWMFANFNEFVFFVIIRISTRILCVKHNQYWWNFSVSLNENCLILPIAFYERNCLKFFILFDIFKGKFIKYVKNLKMWICKIR